MNLLSVSFILCVLVKCVSSSGDTDISSCYKDDLMVKEVMKDALNGIPEYNLKPMDPLVVSSIDFKTKEEIVFHFTDVIIAGLNNVEILDARININEKNTEINMKFNVNINANMVLEFTDINKSISDMKYRAKTGTINVTTKYDFEVSPYDKLVNDLRVENETTTCKLSKDPIVNIDADLDPLLREDLQLQKKLIVFNRNQSILWKT